MPTITKREFEDYRKMCYDRDHGRFLTPNGLRVICEGLNRATPHRTKTCNMA